MSRTIFFCMIAVVLTTGTICVLGAARWMHEPFPGFLVNHRMVLSNVGRYEWTGTQAGLKYPDKIVRANGRNVSSPQELEEALSNTKPGELVVYRVARGDDVVIAIIPTMRFKVSDLLILLTPYVISSIMYLLIGAAVYLMKPDTRVTWSFLAVCFLLSLYNAAALHIVSAHLWFTRISMFANAFIPAAGIHLSLYFPEKKRLILKHPKAVLIPYVISGILLVPIVTLYPDAISLFLHKSAVLPYMLLSALALITAILHSYFKGATPLARQRAKVVLLGAVVAFPVPAFILILSNIGMTLRGIAILNNFLALPIIFFPMSIAYAIARHNLFDVDDYIKRALVYGGMTGFVLLVDLGVHLVIEPFILHPILGDHAKKVYPLFIAVLVVFLFHPVLHRVQKGVDNVFFRKKADYRGTVISISNALTSVLRLEDIVKRLVLTVRDVMFINRAGLILIESETASCRSMFIDEDSDTTEDTLEEDCIGCDDPLISLVAKERKLITVYDVMEDPKYAPVRESCRRRFEELEASVALPLLYENKVKGVLAVGEKKSGHFFTREDIDLLETLSNSGAVAIENVRFAEKVEKQEKVRECLSRYLSHQIVDQIVKENMPVNLGGARKVVTVLSCELRKFREIEETRPPEELVRILNRYFTEMSRIITRMQGSVDRFIGDTIVASFGGLVPLESPPKTAVLAAIEMMQAMPRLNRRMKQEYGLTLEIGIGIHMGEAFVGNVGSPERMEFAVIGEAVDVAARVSRLAEAGDIVVSDSIWNSPGADVRCVDLTGQLARSREEDVKARKVSYSLEEGTREAAAP